MRETQARSTADGFTIIELLLALLLGGILLAIALKALAQGRAAWQTAETLATLEERAAAFDGCFSYAGRWRLVEGRVLHEVEVALNPGLVGSRQWRDARLVGRRLVLSVEEGAGDTARRHALEWRRVPVRRPPEAISRGTRGPPDTARR